MAVSTMISPNATARSEFPNWALLRREARVSDHRNETTAGSRTSEGQAVEVTFWLVDPPAVSYFSVNCPGLESDECEAWLVCAEAAFVLIRLTGDSSGHFVYTARGPAGRPPSLRLIPQPRHAILDEKNLGLLPRGGEHYAVAFLGRSWPTTVDGVRFDAHVYSSKTRAWRTAEASLAHLSDSEKRLCSGHNFSRSRQITAGASSLGWVDINLGSILLLRNLFDEPPVRVIDLIPLPVPKIGLDGDYYCAHEYFCDVADCNNDGLIKFVEIKRDDDDFLNSGKAWRATVWNRRVSWDGWQKRCTVDVDEVCFDRSYSALLPELLDDGTQELELKKLIFYGPNLTVQDDDLLYMMAKVNVEDDDGWAVVIDMKRAAVEAVAKFSVKGNFHLLNTLCCPCVFPKYLNMAQGASSSLLPDDDSRQKKRKERKRSNRRKKKEQQQVQVPRQGLLYLLCFVGCILIAIIVRSLHRFSWM